MLKLPTLLAQSMKYLMLLLRYKTELDLSLLTFKYLNQNVPIFPFQVFNGVSGLLKQLLYSLPLLS